jgi:hypothetical protein
LQYRTEELFIKNFYLMFVLFDRRVLKHRPKFVEEAEQPEFVGEGELKLRDYQLQGLNWLNHAWTRYGR